MRTTLKTMPSETVGHVSRDNLAGAIEAAADLAAAGDRFEQLRARLDCEAFAMRERMEARSAEYFRRKDLEKAR